MADDDIQFPEVPDPNSLGEAWLEYVDQLAADGEIPEELRAVRKNDQAIFLPMLKEAFYNGALAAKNLQHAGRGEELLQDLAKFVAL